MGFFTLRWAAAALLGLILLAGFMPDWQRKLANRQWIADQYRFGDIYNETNIARFKEHNFKVSDQLDSTDRPGIKQAGVHLYTLGDSFTNIDTAYYAAEKNVHVWVGRSSPRLIRLDPRKRNIMVIEVIERMLQERFHDDTWRMYTDQAFVDSSYQAPAAVAANWTETLLGTRFGTDLNSRLEFMLFNNDMALLAKEAKAALLLNWFDRTTGARLSADRKAAFYAMETDTTGLLSSFRHLKQSDIDVVVHHLNRITQYYREMGFGEVYLTLIPNKSTVLAPTLGTYNHQIERVERHPALQPTVISLIDTVRRNPGWYHLGDGHWNRQGRRYWLNRVNGLVTTSPTELALLHRQTL